MPAPARSRPPRLRRQSARLALRDGGLTLACVADTHSQPHAAIAERLPAHAPHAICAPRATCPDVLTLDLVGGDGERRLRILVTHIAVAGPRLRSEVARMARDEQATPVVCGDSHVPFIGRDRELTVFNPGSIGPRRFHLPIVFGAIAITPQAVRLAHIDCETGRPWS